MRTRVAAVEVWMEDLQLTRTYRIAGEEITSAENAFFLLRATDGQIGIGSASPMPEVCGENMKDTLAALHRVSDMLPHTEVGLPTEDLTGDLAGILSPFPAARAAVDMALYDLHCRQLGIPLADYLGRKHTEMSTSVTIGITEEAQVHEELMMHLAHGFKTIKLKIGDDVERDIAIVHKLREWGGREFILRIDANEGYDRAALERFLRATADLQIELIEQPLASPAMDQMLGLHEEIRKKCMADEDLITMQDASTLMAHPAYGVWNIKLMKCGGITAARTMASMAHQAGIQVMWGCNDESRISIAAALHAAFSCTATRYLDLDGSFDIARDIAAGGFILNDGILKLTDAPGLGITLL